MNEFTELIKIITELQNEVAALDRSRFGVGSKVYFKSAWLKRIHRIDGMSLEGHEWYYRVEGDAEYYPESYFDPVPLSKQVVHPPDF